MLVEIEKEVKKLSKFILTNGGCVEVVSLLNLRAPSGFSVNALG